LLLVGRLKVKKGADGVCLLPENNATGCPMTQHDSYCQLTGKNIKTVVSSTNKTDRNNITEILLKVALSTITLTLCNNERRLYTNKHGFFSQIRKQIEAHHLVSTWQ
jgi:hypothetical protein